MTNKNAIKAIADQFAANGTTGNFKTAMACVAGMVFNVEVFNLDPAKYSKKVAALATGKYRNGKPFAVWSAA